jgi:hypothetical protein
MPLPTRTDRRVGRHQARDARVDPATRRENSHWGYVRIVGGCASSERAGFRCDRDEGRPWL